MHTSTHTVTQSGFCLLSLLQRQLLRHTDVSVQMLCLTDAAQTHSTELSWGDPSLPERHRHLVKDNS